MDTQENHKGEYCKKICVYFAPLIAVVLHYFMERETLQTLFSNSVCMVLLSSAYLLFLQTSGKGLYEKVVHKGTFWGCFSASCLFLGLHSMKFVGVLWLLAVAFAAMEVGLELSVSVHVFLMIAYVILVLLSGGELYAFGVYVLFGFILATLFSLYRSKEATGYLAIILLAVDGILQLVLYQLNMNKLFAHGGEIIVEMVGIVLLVIAGRAYIKYVPNLGQAPMDSITQEEREKKVARLKQKVRTQDGSNSRDSMEKESIPGRDVFSQLLAEDFPLVEKLQAYSPELYRHSYRIGELSGRAVEAIGGDSVLARAGGFYHEIGRITGEENYIEAGVALGEEYSFPEELQAVIRQHSTSYELPKSVEAAVVMLSDCIISTSDYLEKSGMREKLSDEKLVHSVFQNRLSKGNLKESGMSVEQLECLQAYFVQHAFQKGVIK